MISKETAPAVPPSPRISKLVIIGVGLIGGSFALALRQAGLVEHVLGIGRSPENMQHALELGVIDEYTDDFAAALPGADFVLLAVPVRQTAHVMSNMAPYLDTGTIVSDVGSTKQHVVLAARTHLRAHLDRFIPAHPIAGTEFSGVQAADPNLFRNKPLILTPLPENSPQALAFVETLWQHCGAKVSHLPVERHDQILAAISHLPHMLAFSLMQHIRTLGGDDPMALLHLAGTSLNDMTRIAGSSPEMWRDICQDNRAALLAQIEAYQAQLSNLHQMLVQHDDQALERLFAEARETRRHWLETKNQSS
ncbi:prephenate dehydrogenase [Nitrosomonas sp. ANs5]|uniref:prephenate dehydrogenase n=1 Tax=Nitrosomonas sp. ANs5 TaxID=3423941 RepID=UPI003D33C090